jgi:hypothetical protein
MSFEQCRLIRLPKTIFRARETITLEVKRPYEGMINVIEERTKGVFGVESQPSASVIIPDVQMQRGQT